MVVVVGGGDDGDYLRDRMVDLDLDRLVFDIGHVGV